jgi:cyclic-di-GMP-binding protein
MSRLNVSKLLPSGTAPKPAVRDLKSCERWLATAPLADPRQACFELTMLLEDIEQAPPGPKAMLEILDRLREPVRAGQDENAKRFSAKPLPLRDQEATAFDQVYDLWTVYGRAYRRLALEARQGSSHPLAKQLRTLLGRSLEAQVELMLAHYRAHRELSSEHWRDLHDLFGIAETFALERVPLETGDAKPPTCFDYYAQAMLLHMASPFALTPRELEWVYRWVRQWSSKLVFIPPTNDKDLLAVDLDGDDPPRIVRDVDAPSYRVIDRSELKKTVKRRITGLTDGYTCTELGLGNDCDVHEASQLLGLLYRQWFEWPVARQFKRRLVVDRAEVSIGFPSIHMAIGGRLARASKRLWDYTRRDTEQLFVYGNSDLDFTDGPQFATEPWEQLDDSANGFRLRRRGPGERLSHHQLVALRPQDAPAFILCEVRWLCDGVDRALTIGVQALPGLAQPISARGASENAMMESKFQQSFVLPSTPGCEPSLVLPLGIYRENRVLELQYEETIRRVRAVSLIQRGFDFERVTFEIVG